MTESIPFIPAHYRPTYACGISFWFSNREPAAHKTSLICTAAHALAAVTSLLQYVPAHALHVCCYHTREDSGFALGRSVSPTMALAPFSNRERGLVVVHSPAVDIRNGDESRGRRLMVHEFVHLLAVEKTGSAKILGDGNRAMRIPTWLNEGLAEVVALGLTSGEERLDSITQEFLHASEFYSFDTLSGWLDDLDASQHARAFSHATAAVRLLCKHLGMGGVFDRLIELGRHFAATEFCTPACLDGLDTPRTHG